MSDDVRTPREFEPPPWEREQFEELRRRREAEAARQAAAASPAEGATGRPLRGTKRPPRMPAAVGSRVPRVAEQAPDGAEVDLMMMELAEQEPDVSVPFRRAGFVVAAIVTAVGLATVIAGAVALVIQGPRGGVMGTIAGSVVIVFGLLLMGGGGWVTVVALRQRGA